MYQKYGDEWEKEVMKNPKKVIVEMLRRVAMERDGLAAVEHVNAADDGYAPSNEDDFSEDEDTD